MSDRLNEKELEYAETFAEVLEETTRELFLKLLPVMFHGNPDLVNNAVQNDGKFEAFGFELHKKARAIAIGMMNAEDTIADAVHDALAPHRTTTARDGELSGIEKELETR